MNVERQEWESLFFGFPVYKIHPPIQEVQLNELMAALPGKAFLYGFFSEGSKEADVMLKKGGKVITTALIYRKVISGRETERTALVYDDADSWRNLIPLALESGRFSRYRLDEEIGEESFQKLYEEWVRKAVEGSFEDGVITIQMEDEIAGMATYRLTDDTLRIGLFAVHPAHRRKGVAKELLHDLEWIAVEQGKGRMAVLTQLQNKPAQALYTAFGMTLEERLQTIHLWKAPN